MAHQSSRRTFLKLASLLSLLPLVRGGQQSESQSERGQPDAGVPNVLIFVLDALSARNMSLYGYRRATTPNLVQFA